VGLSLATLAAVGRARAARADVPFVDRPLTLPPLHFTADAGIGFGQAPQSTMVTQSDGSITTTLTGTKVGWGSSLEAAVGLPFIGGGVEVGARIGIRFGDLGPAAGWGLGADHFARLFDPVVEEAGSSTIANPEFRVRGTIVDSKIVEIGAETRAIVPTGGNSSFELVPGIPLRFHVTGLARIDTGLWFPVEFNSSASYTVDIPAQLFFQAGEAFFGPMSGFRYNHPGGGFDSSVDVPAGIGGGYTVAGVLDLKGELRTERINSSDWARQIGGGIGVGLRLP
jgi:hypothetical protein